MSLSFLETLIAAIVWVVANVVYLDLRRKGVLGFTRLAAFWVGLPTTLITVLLVDADRHPTFPPARDDDEMRLLADIRRDRALRATTEKGRAEDGPPDIVNE